MTIYIHSDAISKIVFVILKTICNNDIASIIYSALTF